MSSFQLRQAAAKHCNRAHALRGAGMVDEARREHAIAAGMCQTAALLEQVGK